ncbi:MAG: DLW-39 family protein [Propionibacteriaceae bacterium]|nr:DLW-39 family protein [Propionibacteriaceae bacterium]
MKLKLTLLLTAVLGASLLVRQQSRRVQAEAELWADGTDQID